LIGFIHIAIIVGSIDLTLTHDTNDFWQREEGKAMPDDNIHSRSLGSIPNAASSFALRSLNTPLEDSGSIEPVTPTFRIISTNVPTEVLETSNSASQIYKIQNLPVESIIHSIAAQIIPTSAKQQLETASPETQQNFQ
jgi:hypothetical protein